MQPWFESCPKRLDYELQALTRAGLTYRRSESQWQEGKLELEVDYPLDGEVHTLTVQFPDLYPNFPFDVFGKTLPDGRHKNPYDGHLCLLRDPHSSWNTSDTLAGILNVQLKKLIFAHQHPDHDQAGLESPEATQLTGYFHYCPSSVVFTGDELPPTNVNYGRLKLGVEPQVLRDKHLVHAMRGVVLEIQNAQGQRLAGIDISMPRFTSVLDGRWVRLPVPPQSNNPAAILDEISARHPNLRYTPKQPDVIGVLFEEEVERGVYRENWIFLVRDLRARKPNPMALYLARADRLSQDNIQARVANLHPLRDKTILIVGLGAIGSTCAMQLARAGVGMLRLLDHDIVQLGNVPRWALGMDAVGHHKVAVLAGHIRLNYPWVKTAPIPVHLGSTSDMKLLPGILEGVDLILDATAEFCVSRYLSGVALERNIPYVWATGTAGSQGGRVGRIVPGRTEGCWECFQRHVNDKTLPMPPEDKSPYVQPVGCFHSTFTGTGFDMDNIALAAVRLAVSTLCANDNTAYPDFKWDLGIASFWKDGSPIAPEWVTLKLARHPECQKHG